MIHQTLAARRGWGAILSRSMTCSINNGMSTVTQFVVYLNGILYVSAVYCLLQSRSDPYTYSFSFLPLPPPSSSSSTHLPVYNHFKPSIPSSPAQLSYLPFSFRHLLRPASNNSRVVPRESTRIIVTPSDSTSLLRDSSSKKS